MLLVEGAGGSKSGLATTAPSWRGGDDTVPLSSRPNPFPFPYVMLLFPYVMHRQPKSFFRQPKSFFFPA